ncbi:hypothetical protein NED98_10920 [Sphingomonas sp. MMSM20]|uniref:hypothetical protein n=1 Tax=Sphingomonas lycopersici TaxID=2951807 RepID=UPI002238E335|nr:hypothetical protein [Sphingomonas lycopersici]MCW6530756.1 hypothetical protein [Sphingomonas lycopersici]
MKFMRHTELTTMIALATLTANPVAAQSALPDQALEQLATRESRLQQYLSKAFYEDPEMRAEFKRVGFANACRAVADSRREVAVEFVPALVPATVAAIKKIVPEQRLAEARPRSLSVGPLWIYAERIDEEIKRTAPEILASATAAMRKSFLKRTSPYATTRVAADNIVRPRADIAGAVGLKDTYDLDNPAQIRLACAEFLISPRDRPTITSEPAHNYILVPPSRKR